VYDVQLNRETGQEPFLQAVHTSPNCALPRVLPEAAGCCGSVGIPTAQPLSNVYSEIARGCIQSIQDSALQYATAASSQIALI